MIDTCLNAPVTGASDCLKLFHFAQQRVYSESSIASDDMVASLFAAIKRLGTWQLVHNHFDFAEWQKFACGSSMVDDMARFLSAGQIEMGITIWRRHHLDRDFSVQADMLVSHIPETIYPSRFVSWIQNELIPSTFDAAERTLLFEWVEDRARIVERVFRSASNALSVLNILECAEMNTGSSVFSLATPAFFVKEVMSRAPAQDDVLLSSKHTKLKQQLEDIVYLESEHDYRICLDDYTQLTPSAISLALLDRVIATELLDEAIKTHFAAYVKRHSLDQDTLLVEYATEIMHGSGTALHAILSID